MAAAVRIRLLGPFEVEGVASPRLGSRKARLLLKLLALARGRPVPTDRIVDVLWGDSPPARPGDQAAVLVSRLRAVLGGDRIVRGDAGYTLLVDWTDLAAFDDLAVEARRREAAGEPGPARVAAVSGLALARGPLLLEEPDAEWLTPAREACTRAVRDLRRLAARTALASGDAEAAVGHARAAVDDDPYDEEAVRLAMVALAACGRRAAALDLYEQVRRRLADDLGVDPAPPTRAAHHALLREEPVGGVTPGPVEPLARTRQGGIGLVGRDREMAALAGALGDVAAARRLHAVLIEGEAGMGKTTLLRAFGRHAEDAGAAVLAGRCDELGRALPLQPILDALDAHLTTVGPAAATALLGDDASLLRPLVGPGAGSGPPVAEVPVPDDGAGRLTVHAALRRVLERLGARSTVVLLLDDLHLAGASTLEWLQYLVRRGGSLPALVVATHRAEEAPPPLEDVARMRLAPLDEPAAAAIVGDDLARRLHGRSAGNPLLLVELARGSGSGDALPAGVVEAVVARSEHLGPAGVSLRAAAVLGDGVDLELLSAALDRPPLGLLDDLDEGVRRGFLEDREGVIVFRHALVREALAESAGAARRAYLHREAARLLAARSGVDPMTVAHHARLGGDLAAAAAALEEAAETALRRLDAAAAVRLLDEAVALDDTPAARMRRARALIVAGRPQEALTDARIAVAAAPTADALEMAGFAAYHARDLVLAATYAEDALAAAVTDPERARRLFLLGRVRHAAGDLAAAEGRLADAAECAGDAERALVGTARGLVLAHLGRPRDALAVLPERVDGADVRFLVPFHRHLAAALAQADSGDPDASLRTAARLAELVERNGVIRFGGRAENIRAWVLRSLGDLDAADEANTAGLELARRAAYVEAETWSLLDLAEGRLRRGDVAGAAAGLEALAPVRAAPHAFAWRDGLRARLLSVRIRLAGGTPADDDAAALVDDAARVGAAKYVLLARVASARSRALAGGAVDRAAVERDLRALAGCAAVEAWWVTAEAAADTATPQWVDLAGTMAASLAAGAGDRRDGFSRYVRTTLERTRSRTVGR